MKRYAPLLLPICAALALAACQKPEVVAPAPPIVVTTPAPPAAAPDKPADTTTVLVPVPGPQGPAGPQGPQGAPGAPGVNNPGDSTNRTPDR